MTALELRTLFEDVSEQDGLRRFFWIWTLKEAYTKALGLGLGFDFRRIEYNVPENVVRVDGAIPKGWQFSKFELLEDLDLYQGVVAEFVGGDEVAVVSQPPAEWLTTFKADAFLQRALQTL
jgi:4'-phosphopantetheinyl transferase